MQAVRQLLAQRNLALLVCAAALLLKMFVPTGYMIDTGGHGVRLVVCPGTVPAVSVPMAMPGMHGTAAGHGTDHGKHDDDGKGEVPCAFAVLSAAILDTIDPVQLAAAIAFILALGFAAIALPARSWPAHLRPPSHGPPALR